LECFFLGVSWMQWFFRYPDVSQLVLGTGIGVCFMVFGYIYYWMKSKDEQFKKIDKRMDDITKFFIKEELK